MKYTLYLIPAIALAAIVLLSKGSEGDSADPSASDTESAQVTEAQAPVVSPLPPLLPTPDSAVREDSSTPDLFTTSRFAPTYRQFVSLASITPDQEPDVQRILLDAQASYRSSLDSLVDVAAEAAHELSGPPSKEQRAAGNADIALHDEFNSTIADEAYVRLASVLAPVQVDILRDNRVVERLRGIE